MNPLTGGCDLHPSPLELPGIKSGGDKQARSSSRDEFNLAPAAHSAFAIWCLAKAFYLPSAGVNWIRRWCNYPQPHTSTGVSKAGADHHSPCAPNRHRETKSAPSLPAAEAKIESWLPPILHILIIGLFSICITSLYFWSGLAESSFSSILRWLDGPY